MHPDDVREKEMTRCPECGSEIPDGQLYCMGCGWEVKLVPDFEPEIENRIDKTLSRLAGKIDTDEAAPAKPASGTQKAKSAGKGRKSPPGRKRRKIPAVRIAVCLCAVLGVAVLAALVHKSESDLVSRAKKLEQQGRYEEAISCYAQAHEKDRDKSGTYLLEEARIRMMYLSDAQGAVQTLDEIINSAAYDDTVTEEAFRMAAEAYLALYDYVSLKKLLENCPYPSVAGLWEERIPDEPHIAPDGGTFAGEAQVTIRAGEGARIYYTLDGSEPDTTSLVYEAPLVIAQTGETRLSAVAVSPEGILSETVQSVFVVEEAPVPAPKIFEDSGVYNVPTRIVATAEKGLTIHYTSDEEQSPTAASEEYTEPIDMPEGDSVFRFVAIDENGRMSEVVTRRYTLAVEAAVSEEEAITNVKRELIAAGHMIDESGRVSGREGYLAFAVDGTVTIGNDGTFYYIREYHVKNDGSRTETGILYAVNIRSGMAKRLGYDTSGKVMLMQF